jgi:hypothetical protein
MSSEFYGLSKRQRLNILESEMQDEVITFRNYYKDLSKYILPRRSRFTITDVNKGDRRNLDILDSTATLASRTLSAGLMTGVTSPARPWFKLATSNRSLNDIPEVKQYLKTVTDEMRNLFLKSNLYNVLPVAYGDLGTFATACIFMEEDIDDVVNFRCFPVGSYKIAVDKKGRVSVFYREFQMSVRQIVEKFGKVKNGTDIDWTNISDIIKEHWKNGRHEVKIDVCHFILPNENYDPNRLQAKYKRFESLYYEKGSSSVNQASSEYIEDKFLRESGYDFFPVLAPRWEVAGEDTYGTNSPGMVALGDVKQLQFATERIAGALDHKVKPPMVGPTNLKNIKSSIIPGHITFVDEREGVKGIRRLFELDFDIRELEAQQEQVRQRISRAFYEDLFLMLANTNRRQITAREVEERHEEKLLALGPVLERINQDLLDPLIDNTFQIMDKRGILPEIPEELQDQDYTVEYISVMAQAQKLAGIGNIERLTGFVGELAGLNPQVLQKLDMDKIIDEYGDLVGTTPNLVRSEEEVEEIREAEAQAAAQAQQAQQMEQMAGVGKTLGDTQINADNALGKLLGEGVTNE